MKKTFSYGFFTFVLSCLFIFVGSKVSATSNSSMWREVGNYTIDEADTGTKHNFNRDSENYNYSFDYSYSIDTSNYIYDNGAAVSYFYGIKENTDIIYRDITPGSGFTIDDRMLVYFYSFTTHEFIPQVNSPAVNTSGTYRIDYPGLYKVTTDGVDGTGRTVYIIYEKEFFDANVDDVIFDRQNQTVEFVLTIKDPRNLALTTAIDALSVDLDADNSYICMTASDYSAVEKETGIYEIRGKFNVPSSFPVATNAKIEVRIAGGGVSKEGIVNYDIKLPVVNTPRYYNNDIINTNFNFEIDTSSAKVLPNISLVELPILDENQISSVTVNNLACEVLARDTNDVQLAKCIIDASLAQTNLEYLVVDSYGNETTLTHTVTYDNKVLDQNDSLSNYVRIVANQVRAAYGTAVYTDLDKLCIVYGTELTGMAECGDENSATASYHYQGPVLIVLLDNSRNYVAYQIEDAFFDNGYDPYFVTFTKDGDRSESDITVDVNTLISMICTNPNCIDSDVLFVKYGDIIEPLGEPVDSKYKLPSYLDMLNNKFRDSSCAKEKCDKTVEVYAEYDVGGITQKVSIIYNYVDKLPTISDNINTNGFDLEYGSFDIDSDGVKQSLYGDELEVTLEDATGYRYLGKITPRFIEYVDKDGKKEAIDNKGYEYISSVTKLGKYVLECQVKLLKEVTTNQVYGQPIYSKSFFLVIDLKDTIMPTLTLLGDKDVEVKQNDAYKDAGYKCEDKSGCTVIIKYYLNNKEVDKIDTSVAGAYTIKYVAKDAAGNTSFEIVRNVNVVGINDVNTTTIIIVVAIVVVFALVITLAIILEIRKNKKRTEIQ